MFLFFFLSYQPDQTKYLIYKLHSGRNSQSEIGFLKHLKRNKCKEMLQMEKRISTLKEEEE